MDDYYLALRTFILYNIHYLMFDEFEFPNISFDFKEKEAKREIYNLIMNELKLNCENIKLSEADDIINAINNPDYTKPVIEISDYKRFFTSLNELIKNEVDRQSILRFLWLRMTPDDFKKPEEFLEKNVSIMRDKTIDKYNIESVIENVFFSDYFLTVANSKSKYFNESMKEVKFTLIKDNVEYQLPVVRYGIYERNNEKVCEIGSIQHITKNFQSGEEVKLEKKVDRLKYKLNAGVDLELIEDIEPKKLISLLLFIKLLQENGIKKLSIPSSYPLDREYHIKRVKRYEYFLEHRWIITKEDLEQREKEMKVLSRNDRVDDICKTKTDNFIKLFERMMYHIEDSRVITYPNDEYSYLEIEIPSLENIHGENVKKLIKD